MSNEYRDGITKNLEIVNVLKNNTIVKILRISDSYSISRYENNQLTKNNEIFNLIPKPILIYLSNGDVVGFYGDELKESVVTWFDIRNGVEDDTTYYCRDWAEYLPHNDSIYSKDENWSHIIGEKIINIKVLIIDQGEKKMFPDSLQRVVILETKKGEMVISYCVLNLPVVSFFPLTRLADFPKELWNKAKIIEL